MRRAGRTSGLRGGQRAPVEYPVPQEPVIGMIQVPVHRVEVERQDVRAAAGARRKVEDRGTPLEVVEMLGAAADDQRGVVLLVRIAGLLVVALVLGRLQSPL